VASLLTADVVRLTKVLSRLSDSRDVEISNVYDALLLGVYMYIETIALYKNVKGCLKKKRKVW